MPTSFFTGIATDVKSFIDGVGERDSRYCMVNSRDRNRKIIRSGTTVTTQFLGIDAPTAAPTGSGGSGSNFFYCYVYINKKFSDPLALEPTDPYIRSNSSPVSAAIASQSTTPTVVGAVSTDPQVTHVWLYVSDVVGGPFVRLTSGYEVANTGTPSWTGTTTVPTAGYPLELDNTLIDTCRMSVECNGFFANAGFVPITGVNGSITTVQSVVTLTTGTVHDGVLGLFLQFDGDTTGGINNDGIHIANFITSTTLQLVALDGSNRTYDGSSNKIAAPFRIYRDPSIIQFAKRYNPDFTPGIVDADFLIRGSGAITGIAKPNAGFVLRAHYNNNGRKSVELMDLTEGLPPKRFTSSSPYAMANPRAYVTAGNRIFYFDAQAGIIEDKGSIHTPLTLPVIPNLIRSLNKASSSIVEMEYDESRNLIFIACAPSGYTRNYYMIVYNLTTNTWNLWFMLPDVLSMRRIADVNGNVFIYMGSSEGSITIWPSPNFNEAVGNSLYGSVTSVDDSTHLTSTDVAFPTTGDSMIDRWVMTWNDADDEPVYQFARVASNAATRLTLDTFIGPNSNSGFSPLPAVGDNFWMGPIQCILGPNFDFNSVPDEDGKIYDVSIATSGLSTAQSPKISLFRNFETEPSITAPLVHNTYVDGTNDPDHLSWKSTTESIETTGVTGWQITDNNEAPLSIKSIVKRIKTVSDQLNQGGGRGRV